MLAGSTLEKVLKYDHTFPRRDPVNPLITYLPVVLKTHKSFTIKLRNDVEAIVKVC